MGINFKKNGRPTKAEKATLKNINNFVSALDKDEKGNYDFIGETVTDGKRLNDIWNSVLVSDAKPKINSMKNADKKENINTETGEITQEREELKNKDTKFATNKETMEKEGEVPNYEEISEELEQQEIPSMFNPLADPVKERSYNKPKETNVGEIAEPNFEEAPTPQEELDEIQHEKEEAEQFEKEPEPSEFDNVTNEAVNELDGKDKTLAAKQLVQTVLDGYETLHELGKHYVKYPEEKLQEKILSEEIDPTMEIALDADGTTTNPVEFIQSFNQQAEEAISYDPEFGEKVRPAMERVFAKKGWGMTDEQFILVAFGKDLGWKGVQIMNLKKTSKGFMDTFESLQREKIEAIKNASQTQPSYSPDTITTPPPPEPAAPPDFVSEEENQPNEAEIVPIH